MAKLKPLSDNVIVKPLDAETTTVSGIIIPDTVSKEKPMRGKLLAIGAGKDGKKLEAKVGDIVIFTQYAPTEVKVEGEDLYILGFDSILAVEE